MQARRIEPLSRVDVAKILRSYGFFDEIITPEGVGLPHCYSIQERKGNSIIIDESQCLMWQQSGNSFSINYDDAKKYIKELNHQRFAGYTDWRLPTIEEAMGLMEREKKKYLYIDPVFHRRQFKIWTSDQAENWITPAWIVHFENGTCFSENTSHPPTAWVRAVRSIQSMEDSMSELTDKLSLQELDLLPTWACVAFSAQCAELLWPCYLNLPADLERWMGVSVRRAIDLSKEAAQTGRVRELVDPSTVFAAAEAVTDAKNCRTGFNEMREAASCAAEAAGYALTAALEPYAAAMYAEKVAGRFRYAAVFTWPHLRGRAREYYNYLLHLSEKQGWNNETTLPANVVDDPEFDPPPFDEWPQPGLHSPADVACAEYVQRKARDFLIERERRLSDDDID